MSLKKNSALFLTLLFNLSNLFHGFLEDCTFVRLDVEVVNVIEVCEDQLRQLLYVFILMFSIAFLSAAFGTVKKNDYEKFLLSYYDNFVGSIDRNT